MTGNCVAKAYAGISVVLTSHFFSHMQETSSVRETALILSLKGDIAAYFLGSLNKFYSKYSSKSWINSIIINSIISIEPR